MAAQKQEQFKFSLSQQDKHSGEVRKIISFLKGKGILSQAVRDGLRLINDLRRGKVKVLLELFPDVVEQLCQKDPPKDDIGELKRMIEDLQRKVDQQQMIYVPADGRDVGLPLMSGVHQPALQQSGSAKPMAVPQFPMPEPDIDDGDTIVITDSAADGDMSGFIRDLDAFMRKPRPHVQQPGHRQ